MVDLLTAVRTSQRAAWASGQRVPAEVYLTENPALSADDDLALDLIYSEVLIRTEMGESCPVEEYVGRFPQYAEKLRRQMTLHELLHGQSTVDGAARSTMAVEGAGVPGVPGYELLALLGSGSGGVVYAARQLSLGRLVAIKMIRPAHSNEQSLALLRREAAVLARLDHPGIVQVHELEEWQGRCYLVMELLEGGSLATRLARGALTALEAARLVEVLARAAHAAHENSIVHRDLKPTNILFTATGEPKIADFGLARRLGGGTSLIPSSMVVGTAGYMAPEQAEGRPVGPAADVYSLGAILHEAITGKPPFTGPTILSVLHQARTAAAPPLPRGTPLDLDRIRQKCLDKDPHRRYATARELAEDLGRFLRGEPVRARRSRWRAVERTVRRHPTAVVALGLVGCFVVLLTWTGWELPGWAEWTYQQGQGRVLRKLHAGQPVDLVGPDCPAPGYRWRCGQGGWVRYRPWTAATGSVVLGAPVPGLLELLPAAPPTPFRVRLELRQEDSFNLFGDVGLYFAHGQRETTQGPLHLFARACYADLGPLADGAKGPRGERGGWLRLQLYSLLAVPEGPPRTFRYTGRGGKAFHVPPDPGQPPGPWRTLTVDVKATEVRAALDAHTVRIDWTKESAYWLKGLKEENGDVHPPDIHLDLAGGMGIYLYGCSVSLRRLSIEPLLAGAE